MAALPTIVILLLGVALAATACRASETSAQAATKPVKTRGPDAFERSGRDGSLRLQLPSVGTAAPYPLIIVLHSLYHEGDSAESTTGFDALATRDGFAVAYPDGLDMSWNAGSCCGRAAIDNVSDVAFIRAVISHLEQLYPIDRRRVSIVGVSNGAMLAYRYACTYPDEIAGIGVVAGSLQVAGCRPAVPVTVVSVHGLKDTLVPYDGQAWSPELQTPITSAHDSLAPFRAVDGCAVPAPRTDSVIADSSGLPAGLGPPGPAEQGGTDAVRLEAQCGTASRVIEYDLPDTAHGWPPLTGPGHFDTAGTIWRVLSSARSQTGGPNL
jgi:polyhydroxybutyrate depolymerase